jgi:hypothetical protein
MVVGIKSIKSAVYKMKKEKGWNKENNNMIKEIL